MSTVVASGHVQNPHRIEISSQMTSTVQALAVTEGDSVRQVLAMPIKCAMSFKKIFTCAMGFVRSNFLFI